MSLLPPQIAEDLNKGWNFVFRADMQACYSYLADQWVGFDDPSSIRAKVYTNMTFWSLSSLDSTWTTFYKRQLIANILYTCTHYLKSEVTLRCKYCSILQAEYVKLNALGGTMVWSLDQDDFTGSQSRGQRFPLLTNINLILKRTWTLVLYTMDLTCNMCSRLSNDWLISRSLYYKYLSSLLL